MLHVNGLYVTQATVAAGAVAANELSVTLSISVLHVVGNYPALIEKSVIASNTGPWYQLRPRGGTYLLLPVLGDDTVLAANASSWAPD